MPVWESPARVSDPKQTKAKADSVLVDFEEEALRNMLIHAAGDQLSQVAESSVHTMGEQIRAIRQSMADFDSILNRMDLVQENILQIDTIGKTFSYLLEMMVMQGVFTETINPLARLTPVVEASDFRAPEQFTQPESEYVLKNDDILISATDTKGKITFANNCFYQIAEYDPGTLVGAPHNVIRHPDMPKTAFADLGAVIKAGKIWQGYVANRSKHGRLYWVKATVFPCYENSEIVGYISIRTKPEPEMVAKAAGVYRLVPWSSKRAKPQAASRLRLSDPSN